MNANLLLGYLGYTVQNFALNWLRWVYNLCEFYLFGYGGLLKIDWWIKISIIFLNILNDTQNVNIKFKQREDVCVIAFYNNK